MNEPESEPEPERSPGARARARSRSRERTVGRSRPPLGSRPGGPLVDGALVERGVHRVAELVGLGVGERALGGPEHDPEQDVLLPRPDPEPGGRGGGERPGLRLPQDLDLLDVAADRSRRMGGWFDTGR